MGRFWVFLPFFLIICACNPQKVTYQVSRAPSAAPSANAPARWELSAFPLGIIVSDEFDNAEVGLFDQMAEEWSTAAEDQIQFFSSAGNSSNKDFQNLSTYRDSELGIYKKNNWFSDVSPFALAITQFFGYRRNTGSASEYIQLTHADIMINYDFYTFSTDGSFGTYDLPTVILHEMGHFLGLYHYSGNQSSVMQPYLDTGVQKRAHYPADKNLIMGRYGLTETQSIGSSSFSLGRQSTGFTDPSREGEMVRGVFELRTNGDCHHVINGKTVSIHTVSLKK